MLLAVFLIFHVPRVARADTNSDGTTVAERLASRSSKVKQILCRQHQQDGPDGKIQAAEKELGAVEKEIKAKKKELGALEKEIKAKEIILGADKKKVKGLEKVLESEKKEV